MADAEAPAELARCYLHAMGDGERARLAALQQKLPWVAQSVREASASAPGRPLTIWGVDMQGNDAAADILLLKFLRAADLDVEAAAARLVDTLKFRAEEGVDGLMGTELPEHFRGHDTVKGTDVDGRPVMISRYGQMDNQKVFGDVDTFVRYRMQIMEQAVANLQFKEGAAEDLCQIHDYSGVPLLFKTPEVQAAVNAMTKVFAQHYPETKGKTIFVNFPSVFSKLFQAFSGLIPERTRKKFLILGKSDHVALFDHVKPELVPEALGGMLVDPPSKLTGPCHVVTVKGREQEEVALAEVAGPASFAWDLRVCRDEASYELVFVPAEGSAEQVISSSAPGTLRAEDGVISGDFRAEAAGSLRCRFKNGAWLQNKVCVCRAECLD